MNQNPDIKRVFFAFEAIAPWPEKLPTGRCLAETDRHLTVAFLGDANWTELNNLLPLYPKPEFSIGKAGIFNRCLFLPERHPNVVAWQIDWLDETSSLNAFHEKIVSWLKEHNLPIKVHDSFLPHVTICRKPFEIKEWKHEFNQLPVFIKNFSLYESLGHSTYRPCWTHPLKAPFEEIDHTADVAFLIRGQNIIEILQHARLALAFNFPDVLPYISNKLDVNSLDDIIIHLNEIVTELDQTNGCPFKAVSFHGLLKETSDKTLEWEMIVDV